MRYRRKEFKPKVGQYVRIVLGDGSDNPFIYLGQINKVGEGAFHVIHYSDLAGWNKESGLDSVRGQRFYYGKGITSEENPETHYIEVLSKEQFILIIDL